MEPGLFGVEDVGGHGGDVAVELAAFDGEFAAGDFVLVSTVGQRGAHLDLVVVLADVDEGCTGFAAADFDYGAFLGGGDFFAFAVHACAELVGGHYFGVLEFIVAASAEHVVAPVIFTGASGGTAVEERAAVLAGGEEYPAHAHLGIGHVG